MTQETPGRKIPSWYNPQLKELLNDLYSRIEELERVQKLRLVRPSILKAMDGKTRAEMIEAAQQIARLATNPLPRSE